MACNIRKTKKNNGGGRDRMEFMDGARIKFNQLVPGVFQLVFLNYEFFFLFSRSFKFFFLFFYCN